MVQQIQSMIQHVQQLTLVVQNLISFGPMYPYAAAMYEGCMLSPDAAISIPFSTDAEQYFPEDVVNPAFQPEVDSTLPATGAQSTTADAGEGDQIVYKIWVPSGKHFIKDGSQTRLDLENEAASRIQSFFRFCSPCSSDGESLGVSELADQLFADGEAGSRDDGSDDAAIVQAFVASTCSNSSSLPSRISFQARGLLNKSILGSTMHWTWHYRRRPERREHGLSGESGRRQTNICRRIYAQSWYSSLTASCIPEIFLA
jgi:hypothetical protein